MWDHRRETRKQLARFLIVGFTSVAVDFAFYAALTRLSWHADVAKAVSYLTGVIVGFCGNKWWTFESTRRSAAEPIAYLACYAVTLIANVLCNRSVLALFGESASLWAFLVATGVTTVLNFIGMKFITFRRGVEERRERAVRKAA